MQNPQSSNPNLRSLVLIALSALISTFILWNLPILFFYVVSRIEHNRLTLSPSYALCETAITSTKRIKVSAHREQSKILGKRGRIFVYSVTKDQGNTWVEFMRFYPDESARMPECENIKALDDQHIWVWEGWLLGITHDGGTTWTLWEPQNSWSEGKGDNFHLIMDVQFDDPNTGIMYLDTGDTGEASMTVRTEDGGKTWK
jgi:photosystem II stability/assembly factor-like uncharacterized protein